MNEDGRGRTGEEMRIVWEEGDGMDGEEGNIREEYIII